MFNNIAGQARTVGAIGILQFSELKDRTLSVSIYFRVADKDAEEKLSSRVNGGGHPGPDHKAVLSRALILVPGPQTLLNSPV